MEERGRDGWNVNKQRAASGRVYCLAERMWAFRVCVLLFFPRSGLRLK